MTYQEKSWELLKTWQSEGSLPKIQASLQRQMNDNSRSFEERQIIAFDLEKIEALSKKS